LSVTGPTFVLVSKLRGPTGNWNGQDVDGLRYEVLLPEHYDPAHAYAVVVYWHQLDAGTDFRGRSTACGHAAALSSLALGSQPGAMTASPV